MYRGLRGSMGTLDNTNPTRLSKRHQMSPYIFHHRTCAKLLYFSYCTFCSLTTCAAFCPSALLNFFCYAFCGIATYTVFFSPFLLSTFFHREHFLYLYPSSLHLKHFTFHISSFVSYLLNFTLHLITLLARILNLFWGVSFPFSFCSFLQY